MSLPPPATEMPPRHQPDGGELVNVLNYPVYNVLPILLQDKTTRDNITLSSDAYLALDASLTPSTLMTEEILKRWGKEIACPRVFRSGEQQEARTRKKAEVFTPAWLCNKMNNYCDEEWFGQSGVFNTETDKEGSPDWEVNDRPLPFTQRRTWKRYVDSRRLEITCGEAPYLVSRYDAATGCLIPIKRRIGILDRKLRAVSENASADEWHKWVIRAFQSVYGYEFQGDNVLIARINLLNTYVDCIREHWHRSPDEHELAKIANIIAWNIWQMDGLNGTVAKGTPTDALKQKTLFDFTLSGTDTSKVEGTPYCKIRDWRAQRSRIYKSLSIN